LRARESFLDYGVPGFTLATANGYVDGAIREESWIVPMLHGIEEGYQALDRAFFRAHLGYIKEHEGDLWVDTFANVSRYVREREMAEISIKSNRSQRLIFTVACKLDPKIYNVPLTVVLRTPAAGTSRATATRDGQPIPLKIMPARVLLDVVPGPKPITVCWE
jgi:hypothetical protein